MNQQGEYIFCLYELVLKMMKNENNDGTDIGSSILDENVPKENFWNIVFLLI